jgi:type I restriction enzyme S subunit
MKSNYKIIGDFIRPIKVKNIDGSDKFLLGININKYFMPSVANVVGTDLSRYKIVKKEQFSCNRMHVGRDKRLPVALSNQEDDFIVSPAYDVFVPGFILMLMCEVVCIGMPSAICNSPFPILKSKKPS